MVLNLCNTQKEKKDKEGRERMEGRSHKKEREGGKERKKRKKEKKRKLEEKLIYLKKVKENILAYLVLGIADSVDMNLSKLWKILKEKETCGLQSMRVIKS